MADQIVSSQLNLSADEQTTLVNDANGLLDKIKAEITKPTNVMSGILVAAEGYLQVYKNSIEPFVLSGGQALVGKAGVILGMGQLASAIGDLKSGKEFGLVYGDLATSLSSMIGSTGLMLEGYASSLTAAGNTAAASGVLKFATPMNHLGMAFTAGTLVGTNLPDSWTIRMAETWNTLNDNVQKSIAEFNNPFANPTNSTVSTTISGDWATKDFGNGITQKVNINPDLTISRPYEVLTLGNDASIVSQRLNKTLATPTETFSIYSVQPGDTLSALADRYGMSTSALQAINPAITDPNMIYAGESIYVPLVQHDNNAAFAPTDVTVGQNQFYVGGDYTSIDAISYITGCTQDQLLAANPGVSLTDLIVGQALSLPSDPAVTTNYNADTGALSKTINTSINGQTVNVTYTYDSVTGEAVPHINSINGEPPLDQAAADAGFGQVAPGQLVNGDAGVAGTEVGGVVAANDPTHPTGLQTLTSALTTAIDTLSLIKAIQSGEPLPIVASGLNFASHQFSSNTSLAGAANVANGVLSLMQLDAALKRGDDMATVTAGAQTLSYGVTAYADLIYDGMAKAPGNIQDISTFLNGNNTSIFTPDGVDFGNAGVLSYLNLVNSISNGDALGTAINTLAIVNPAVGVPIALAYTVFNMIDSIFGGSDAPPEAWGTATAHWAGNDAATSAAGAYGGLETATSTYDGFLSYLDQIIAQQQEQNPSIELGIVANRLPSITFRDYSGYTLTDTDPLTGGANAPGMHYDKSGRPYDAPPGSEQASQSLNERFIRVALERDAIAPMWEVDTAALQTAAGDPMAGLTEEERAGRAGKLAELLTANDSSQIFRPVALDLNGDGVKTTGNVKTVAIDVDGSQYLKNTAWLDNNDGFLFLDRNLNGQIDGGRELFNNGVVALSERGLAGMRWIDSNYDGKLTALDPVWDQLKVWQDTNGDGVASYTDSNGNGAYDATEPSELKTLAQLGITELDYAMGTFTHNGVTKQLASPDLAADAQGAIAFSVPEGIVVKTSQGEISLLATQVDDKSLLEANRDGVTGIEDTELIISGADLLANDTLAGLSGQDLSITGVSNFTHGTGFLDDNGNVHYTPEGDYFGEAGFEYSLQASTGRAANDSEWIVARRAA